MNNKTLPAIVQDSAPDYGEYIISGVLRILPVTNSAIILREYWTMTVMLVMLPISECMGNDWDQPYNMVSSNNKELP